MAANGEFCGTLFYNSHVIGHFKQAHNTTKTGFFLLNHLKVAILKNFDMQVKYLQFIRDDYLEFTYTFLSNYWLPILTTIIGIVGIFSAIIFRARANPVFQSDSLRLIGHTKTNTLPSEVSVKFKEKEVSRLTKTTIVFWNKGSKTIDRNDIAPLSAIKICFEPGEEIFAYEIVNSTRDVINFNVARVPTRPFELQISFDYLDSNDGATIEILHDSKLLKPGLSGAIKGIKTGIKDLGRIPQQYTKKYKLFGFALSPAHFQIFFTGIVAITGIVFATNYLLPEHMQFIPKNELSAQEKEQHKKYFAVFTAILYCTPLIYFWMRHRTRFPKNLITNK